MNEHDIHDIDGATHVLDLARQRLAEKYRDEVNVPIDTVLGLSTRVLRSPLAADAYKFMQMLDYDDLVDAIGHLAIVAGRKHHK